MFQPDTDSDSFGFYRNTVCSQPAIYIPCGMSGCQYHRTEKSLSCVGFNTFDFVVLNNQCIHSGLKMHLSTTLDNRIPHILNDTREFVCPNVRMGIGQYSRRSSVLTEYIQYLVYISSFLATGVKFSIRIGSCASFAKTIVRFRIYGMFSADLCQIFFPFAHIFSSFYDNRT